MAALLVFIMVSCGGEDTVGSDSLLSGADNKTWHAAKELNAAGENEPLKQEEQKETLQFYADGRFAMGGGSTLQTGTWSFDQSAKRLSLNMEGQEGTMNFEVEKLTDDELRLKTPDGSTMELEAD